MSNQPAVVGNNNRIMRLDREELVALFDSTILGSYVTEADISRLCHEALANRFWSVCINPFWVRYASSLLLGKVKVCTVAGFPIGANTTEVKVTEARRAIADGADEVDLVLNIGAMKGERYEIVEDEITKFVEVSNDTEKEVAREVTTKVILETYLFLHVGDDAQRQRNRAILERTCNVVKKTGVDYVKTCTGFDTGSGKSITLPEDVAFVKRLVGPNIRLKASGGIKSLEQVVEMVRNGAQRIGTSSALAIVKEFDTLGKDSISIY